MYLVHKIGVISSISAPFPGATVWSFPLKWAPVACAEFRVSGVVRQHPDLPVEVADGRVAILVGGWNIAAVQVYVAFRLCEPFLAWFT